MSCFTKVNQKDNHHFGPPTETHPLGDWTSNPQSPPLQGRGTGDGLSVHLLIDHHVAEGARAGPADDLLQLKENGAPVLKRGLLKIAKDPIGVCGVLFGEVSCFPCHQNPWSLMKPQLVGNRTVSAGSGTAKARSRNL